MAASDPTQPPEGLPEEEVDALYGLPLDEFTPRRDALAKELRSNGRRDEAAWVKALRKPSTAAWLVNQLARTQASDAKRVLDAGDALRAAQDRTLAGEGGPDELARAAEEHVGAMRGFLAKASGMLDREGGSPSETTLQRAAETLRAIPLDEEARAGFATGRLTREHRAAGLGFVPSGEAAPPGLGRGARGGTRRAEAKPDAKEKARARAALKDAKSRLGAREREVAELERALGEAEQEADAARRRLERAAAALDQARAKEAEAQAQLEEAEAAAERLR